MKPARRARSGFHRTTSINTARIAVAPIAATVATTIPWCSGPLTP